MFFTDEEMKQAEVFAWENLDGWNHEYGHDLKNHPHFYFKNHLILDPWVNEKGQVCIWPDHKDRKVAVDPVKYYGEKTMEDFMVQLFLKWSGDDGKTQRRIKGHLGNNGLLVKYTDFMPVEVYVAMSEEQAHEEDSHTCIEDALLDSERVYYEMVELPPDLAEVVQCGWEREIVFPKRNAAKVFDMLYPDGKPRGYRKLIDRVHGSKVRLIGFGD